MNSNTKLCTFKEMEYFTKPDHSWAILLFQYQVTFSSLLLYIVELNHKQRVKANQVMVTTLHGDVFPPGHIGSTSCHCQKDLWTGSRNGHAVHHLGAKKTVEMCAVVDSGAQNNVYTTIGRNPPCTAINPCRN